MTHCRLHETCLLDSTSAVQHEDHCTVTCRSWLKCRITAPIDDAFCVGSLSCIDDCSVTHLGSSKSVVLSLHGSLLYLTGAVQQHCTAACTGQPFILIHKTATSKVALSRQLSTRTGLTQAALYSCLIALLLSAITLCSASSCST